MNQLSIKDNFNVFFYTVCVIIWCTSVVPNLFLQTSVQRELGAFEQPAAINLYNKYIFILFFSVSSPSLLLFTKTFVVHFTGGSLV